MKVKALLKKPVGCKKSCQVKSVLGGPKNRSLREL